LCIRDFFIPHKKKNQKKISGGFAAFKAEQWESILQNYFKRF